MLELPKLNKRNLYLIVNILKRKDTVVYIGIGLLTLIMASQVSKYQHSRINSMKAQISFEEKRAVIGKELSGLNNQLSAAVAPYLRKDLSAIIDLLQRLAVNSKIDIVSLVPDKENEQRFSYTVLLNADLKAGYHNLGRFISLIESQKDILQIERIKIENKEAQGPGESQLTTSGSMINNLSVKMVISANFVKPQ